MPPQLTQRVRSRRRSFLASAAGRNSFRNEFFSHVGPRLSDPWRPTNDDAHASRNEWTEPGWATLQPGGFKPDIVVADKPEDETERRPPVEVWLHNDDYTPAEYVVTVLEQEFGLGWWKANWIMVKAHATGHAVVGSYPRAEAEQRVAAAERGARSDGWPLRLTVEDLES